ncbi:uncharacterized protein LOC130785883 [Actinidia eriantha]|uniref:uncharacterized protein LOC130785883 n=1 Tax=Actinidia eriantha TaxID=165200 RepID=UPI00258C7E29|nr:uncharacterized protein LOC130785883 [Actinidia eriantha]
MHNIHRSHRDAPNESTREKNIGAAYEDYEYDSNQGILAWELEELVRLQIEDSTSLGIERSGKWQRQCPAKVMVLTSSMVFQVILPPGLMNTDEHILPTQKNRSWKNYDE